MSALAECPKCKRPLPASAPEGLCPICLFERMLAPADLPVEEADAGFNSPAGPGTAATAFCGDYELLQEIARGGMGIVYRARPRRGNQTVALKMVLASHLAGETAALRFRAEAEAAASLEHPNIVPIYEVGVSDGRLFYTMTLFTGGTLADQLRNAAGAIPPGAEPISRARPFVISSFSLGHFVLVARAVHYAHQHGILHRDLKPANILLDAAGGPHVSDFGLAKRLESDLTSLTISGAALGTPNYMAPEQARGGNKQLTTAADIYGLGAILYELLTGQPPFRGGTPLETMRRVLEEEPKRPTAINRLVERDLETICLKCLHKEPARRYASAAALADDLERWLRNEPVRARPITTWEKSAKWIRRHPAGAAFLALAAVAPAIIIAILLSTAANVRRERNRALAQEQHARASELATHQNLYAADIAQAHAALAANDYDQAWRSLAAHRPADSGDSGDPRGFEWRWLWSLAQGESLRTAGANPLGVFSMAFSPDARFVASGEGGGIVNVWDAETLRPLRALIQPGNDAPAANATTSWDTVTRFQIYSVSFSPDSRLLVAASRQAWDIADSQSGQWLRRLPGGDWAMFPPGASNRIFGVHGTPPKEFAWYDATHSHPLTNWPCASYGFALSADARLLASFERPLMVVRDLVAGKTIASFRPASYVTGMAFSPDSRTLGLCLMNEGAVDLWNVEPWEHRGRLERHTGRIACLAFSPDGRRLATGGYDQTVRLWDVAGQNELRQLHGHRAGVHAIEFSPDGRRVVTGGFDGTVRLWDVTPAGTPPAITNVFGVFAFSPDGRRLVAQDGAGRATLWDLSTHTALREWNVGPFDDALFANDRLWLIGRGSSNTAPRLTMLSLDAPNGATNQEIRLEGVASPGTTAALTPGGRICVTGHADGTVAFWDTASGKLRHTDRPHTNEVFRFAFSQSGKRLAAVTWDTTWITTWDVATGQRLGDRRFALRFAAALAAAPDDAGYAMGGAAAGSDVRLFSMTNGAPAGVLSGHLDDVRRLAYSPDGRTLASTSLDRSVRLWHRATGRTLVTLPQGEQLEHLAFSADGTWLGVATAKGELRLWHAPQLVDLPEAVVESGGLNHSPR